MTLPVAILTTGGTIAHRSRQDGVAVMDPNLRDLLSRAGIAESAVRVEEVYRKGSMDVVPEDWHRLALATRDAIETGVAGVVILHGTDTLHYTAAALSFLLRDAGVPIVLTGSMIPGGDPGSDALPNLKDAVTVAAKADFAEVCVVFSADAERSKGLIIRGPRARKMHSCAIDAFESINAPAIGAIVGGVIKRAAADLRPRAPFRRHDIQPLEIRVPLIKLTPNLTPDALRHLLRGAEGVVLEGTGVGHIRTDLQPVVRDFGKPAVVTTQALYGGERLGRYEVDQAILAIPNVIGGGVMTGETALVKLMWALGQGGDVGALMRTNIAGEL